MEATLLHKLFGNITSTVVKGIAKRAFGSVADELCMRVEVAIERAAAAFFERFGAKYGQESSSFLAREANWILVAKSLRYDTLDLSSSQLNPQGFNDAPDADEVALRAFVDLVEREFKSDLFLNLLLGVKESVALTRESERNLAEALSRIEDRLRGEEQAASENETSYDVRGGDLPHQTVLAEGKLYTRSLSKDIRMTYMRRGRIVYFEASMHDGTAMYGEIDENAHISVRQPPYPVHLYIPPEYILSREYTDTPDGSRKLLIRCKWGLSMEGTVTSDGYFANPSIKNGEVKFNSRDRKMVIVPKDLP